MTLAIFLLIAIILAGIQTAVPFLVKRTIIFGITVPEKNINDATLSSYKKKYALLVSLLSIVALTWYAIWALTSSPSEEQIVLIGTIIQFAIILFSFTLYFYFHGKTFQLKKKMKWWEKTKQVQIADLSARAKDEMLPWYVFLVPMLITVGLIGYTIAQYDLLPDQIPTHWGVNGEADAFTEKTPVSAISSPLMLLVMQAMFLAIIVGTKASGIKISATATDASRLRQLSLRKYTSWLMFLTTILLTGMFSFFQLRTIHPDIVDGTIVMAVPIIFLFVTLASTIAFAIKVGRSDKTNMTETNSGIRDFDDDAHWVGGLFYFNRHDPSIFVEKRFGVGWTINFGNPIGYFIVLVPLAIILLFSFL
ncbi:DUF5808 domain-containing protein [Bacillus sp. JJ1566]|uniref:DUF1648 domain-containing protein n=1 Tax=Bacillus sp. JJ1566 TaxID=3122961 RepID=UPI002FFFF713